MRKYYLSRIKILIFVILICTTIFLFFNLPFFIIYDSDSFIDKKDGFFIPTILFNLANILHSASVILYLLTFLKSDESVIDLEIPLQLRNKKGNIPIGRILKGKAKRQKFYLSLKDLEKHMFICGATGTGKSNFLQNFLINFKKIYKIPFFLVEFKGEYHFLQKKIDGVLILWPGENFSINIFNPGEVSPIIHAERIFDILKSGKLIDENSEFSPQMEKVLVEILVKVCENKNFQNWKGFEYFCKDYLKKNKNSIPMLNQTLISIKNRIRRFSIGPLKSLFEKKNEITIDSLFKRNILMDLSSIIRLGGEKEDALFFLNMILKYLWDKNLSKGAYNFDGIKHITIIEDAQYFAPQDLMKKSKLTTYLEDIALLQRGTGECLITLATRPDISKEILANNGIVLTFKNHIEKEIMCELLNIDAENKNFLSILEEGQCIIRVNSIKEPFLLKIPYIKHESLTVQEIRNNNQLILKKIENDFGSVSKLKNGPFKGYFMRVVKNIFSIKSKKNKLKKDTPKEKLSRNYEGNMHNVDIKCNAEESVHKADSYNKLENYLNYLYKLHKKKE
ncbi:MAG: ATP-binding protein [Promethearchaeota archaeon]|nr:MAG: ATP-binding protein [Candidatus Lokiarchaeota archaeon]